MRKRPGDHAQSIISSKMPLYLIFVLSDNDIPVRIRVTVETGIPM